MCAEVAIIAEDAISHANSSQAKIIRARIIIIAAERNEVASETIAKIIGTKVIVITFCIIQTTALNQAMLTRIIRAEVFGAGILVIATYRFKIASSTQTEIIRA